MSVSAVAEPAESVAQSFWQSRQAASLAPMQNMLEAATADYTAQLAQDATLIERWKTGEHVEPARANVVDFLTLHAPT